MLLDQVGSDACTVIPGVKTVDKQVVRSKKDDKHFTDCDEKNVCAVELRRARRRSSARSRTTSSPTSRPSTSAIWMKAHPTDTDTRALMTQIWIDSSQYKKALDYWEALDKAKPNDPEIMGSLAGINLKANDWRKSIEWYLKVAAVATDAVGQGRGLPVHRQRRLVQAQLEDADPRRERRARRPRHRRARSMPPRSSPITPSLSGCMASIFNFRGQAQGASWAALRSIVQLLKIFSTLRAFLTRRRRSAAGQRPDPDSGTPARPV